VQANCTSGGFTNYSASSTFTTTGVAPIIYCTSVGQSLDGIANVTFNTISNTTALNAYTDYTGSISTTVSTGTTYPLTVKINTGGNYTNYTKAWIDWNHDGVFSTTTEEYNLGTAVNVTSGNTSLSPLNITVPTGAFIGTTRMRVSTQYASNPTPCLASFDGEVEDYAINVILGSSCSTPSGLTSSGVNGTVATVSWTSTGAASYNLQYKLSSATTWTSVSNITANSYALSGLTPCSTYNFQVQAVCGTTTSALSTSASFTTAGCTNYCASYGTNQTREYIKRVTLGTINNTTGANTGGYGNYTTLSTNLTGGSTYTISLLPGFVSSSRREYFRVYIDYNRNGSFETAELIGSVNGTSATTALTKSFTIPTSALNGPTRMRVQMQYNAYPTTACSVFTYGEVEDYTVTIQGNTYFGSESAETEEVIDETSFLTLYPNPTNQELNVQIASVQSGIAQVRIFDLSGSMMKSHQLAVNAGVMNVKLDVSDLSNGIYLLEIQGCDRLETKRFIVQH
jgi:hypothetical protein